MKLFYIANSRIPTEKAHGIQIMKMLEAFSLSELKTQNSKLKTANQNPKIEVELIIPRRINKIQDDPFKYYDVKRIFSIKKLPCLDLIPLGLPKIGFWIQAAIFGFFAMLYLLFKSKPEDIIYSRDEFSLWFLSFLGRNLFWEAHVFPGSPRKYQRILKKIKGLVVISHGLKKSFSPYGRSPEGRQDAGVSEEKILIAPDAVDMEKFKIQNSKIKIREELNLPINKKIIMYTGHLYGWKGVNTLLETACNFQFPISNFQTLFVFVGGTEEDVESYKLKAANCKNAVFVGHKPHQEIPFWLKAADILVLPNSAKEKISAIYTSPLKLFEYMAAGKPIVASDLPSLREILNENTAVLVEPDNPEALAEGIKKVLEDGIFAEKIAENAAKKAKNYTWEKRAQNILTFLSNKAIIK